MKSEEYREMRFVDKEIWQEGLILPDKGKVVNSIVEVLKDSLDLSKNIHSVERITGVIMDELYEKAINMNEEEVEK